MSQVTRRCHIFPGSRGGLSEISPALSQHLLSEAVEYAADDSCSEPSQGCLQACNNAVLKDEEYLRCWSQCSGMHTARGLVDDIMDGSGAATRHGVFALVHGSELALKNLTCVAETLATYAALFLSFTVSILLSEVDDFVDDAKGVIKTDDLVTRLVSIVNRTKVPGPNPIANGSVDPVQNSTSLTDLVFAALLDLKTGGFEDEVPEYAKRYYWCIASSVIMHFATIVFSLFITGSSALIVRESDAFWTICQFGDAAIWILVLTFIGGILPLGVAAASAAWVHVGEFESKGFYVLSTILILLVGIPGLRIINYVRPFQSEIRTKWAPKYLLLKFLNLFVPSLVRAQSNLQHMRLAKEIFDRKADIGEKLDPTCPSCDGCGVKKAETISPREEEEGITFQHAGPSLHSSNEQVPPNSQTPHRTRKHKESRSSSRHDDAETSEKILSLLQGLIESQQQSLQQQQKMIDEVQSQTRTLSAALVSLTEEVRSLKQSRSLE
eukprot:751054-Hanusia_phi.AAC.5